MSIKSLTAFSLFASLIAAIGGLLFGYNTSVISGAIIYITREFALSTWVQEFIVSILLIGALIGAFVGGILADRWGRKPTLFFTAVLFLIGTLWMSLSYSADGIFWGRWISGLAVGISSTVVPLYIAEISPSKCRGALVSLNQLAITLGILISYIVNYSFSSIDHQWRYMFGFALLPTAALFLGLFFISETPSWLAIHGSMEKGKKVLRKIHREVSEEKIFQYKTLSEEPKVSWKVLFDKSFRAALVVGIGMSIIQQITGINTVIYYAPRIFTMADLMQDQSALLATVGIGVVNVIMTLVGLWLVDRAGRKPLLIIGLIGMTLSLLTLGWAFYVNNVQVGTIAVISLMIYVAFFAISLGIVVWLIVAEVFPSKIRGRAMGVAIFISWTTNYFVSVTFLSLVEWLRPEGAFWLYAAICILALIFVLIFVPETKGRTFQEIQNYWKKETQSD